MSKAEALISAKLRQSYENDLQAMVVSKVGIFGFIIHFLPPLNPVPLYCLNTRLEQLISLCSSCFLQLKQALE